MWDSEKQTVTQPSLDACKVLPQEQWLETMPLGLQGGAVIVGSTIEKGVVETMLHAPQLGQQDH